MAKKEVAASFALKDSKTQGVSKFTVESSVCGDEVERLSQPLILAREVIAFLTGESYGNLHKGSNLMLQLP